MAQDSGLDYLASLWRSDRIFEFFLEGNCYPLGLLLARKDLISSKFRESWQQERRFMSGGNARLSGSATGQEHYHAFLSHNGAGKPLVEILAAELEKHSICCWLDKSNLIPGDPWHLAIEEALSRCDTCVVLFGPHGLGPWHNEEMWLTLQRRVNSRERKLRVLPVILSSGQRVKESDLPGFLQGTTWVEFRQSIDEEDATTPTCVRLKKL